MDGRRVDQALTTRAGRASRRAVLRGLAGIGLSAAGLSAVAPRPVAAQEGTPGAEPFALTVLATAPLGDLPTLPPAPALAVLYRITYAAGAGYAAPALPGPLLGSVEEGALTARPDGPLTVTSAAELADPAPLAVQATPGADYGLAAGDQVVTPGGTAVTYANAGAGPSAVLVGGVFPADTPLPTAFPPGVSVRPLAVGVVTAYPPDAAGIGFLRVTLGPGAVLPPGEVFGPTLTYLEVGTVAYQAVQGDVQIVRAAPGGTPVVGVPATPGTEATLTTGDTTVEQHGTVSGLRNLGDAPAVALAFAVLPPPFFI